MLPSLQPEEVAVLVPYSAAEPKALLALHAAGFRAVHVLTITAFQGQEARIFIPLLGASVLSPGFAADSKRPALALSHHQDALFIVANASLERAASNSGHMPSLVIAFRDRRRLVSVRTSDSAVLLLWYLIPSHHS